MTTRICFPFVRYTLNIPYPDADIPRLKYRDCSEKRGESGKNLQENGSSNDSSTSFEVNPSHSNGKSAQSNSISAGPNLPLCYTLSIHCQYIFEHSPVGHIHGSVVSFDSPVPLPDHVPGPEMRLTHFFTYFRNLGGVQSILKRHHHNDGARGHDSRFLFSFEPDNFAETNISGLGIGGWDSIRRIRTQFRQRSDLFQESVAICHNMWGLQFLADLMPTQRRVGLLHSDWTDLQPFLRSQRGLLDGMLCVSNALVDLVTECLPELAEANRIKIIPYPVDGLPEMPTREPLASRPVVIGWVGRMQEEQKRVERLPALLKAFDEAQIDYRFELLGDGPREAWLRQQLPSERSVFRGRQTGDDYYSVLSGWDFITSVSDYEGLPISMLEAFSAGVLPLCPAIGCGGDEYAGKLGADFVWNAFDYGQAAEQLKSHLAKPESALGQARQAARELTTQHSEAEYFRIFDEFVEHIANEPRVSRERLAKRPFYFSDQRPFGLMPRLGPSGCYRQNE